jgi:hypothetical protein
MKVERYRALIATTPGYEAASILPPLEAAFYMIGGTEFSRELSIESLTWLIQAYDEDEVARFDSLIDEFLNANRDRVERVIHQHQADDRDTLLLLHQPECLVIFERLENRPILLKSVFDQQGLESWGEALKDAWG